jgi:hypothetical protein
MTTTFAPAPSASTSASAAASTPGGVTPSSPRLWRTGLVAGTAAAVATTVIAAVARAADVPLAMAGEAIPIAGFAQLTLACTAVGVILAWVINRRAARPRQSFVTATVVLTVLSCGPDVIADASTASKVVLVVTHLVAAAIVIPSIAARLPDTRSR